VLDACVEHLGRLPSQLNLSDDALFELLTYHRIKRRSQSVCKECLEKLQDAEKTCFVCERTYTEKRGPVSNKQEADPLLLDMMRHLAQHGSGKPASTKHAKDATVEESEAFERAFLEKLKRQGVKLLD